MRILLFDEISQASHLTEAEFLQEIAILLYQGEKLSLGKASKLARMGRIQFQLLLASRQISVNYDVDDFESDLTTLRKMEHL